MECQDIITSCEQLGFAKFNIGKNHHGALQLLVHPSTTNTLAKALEGHIDCYQIQERRNESESSPIPSTPMKSDPSCELSYAGLNRRWRVYKYEPDATQNFAPHIDAGFPPSGLSCNDPTKMIWDVNHDRSVNQQLWDSSHSCVSRLTVLFYLNDDFLGGETTFFQPMAEFKASPQPSPANTIKLEQQIQSP